MKISRYQASWCRLVIIAFLWSLPLTLQGATYDKSGAENYIQKVLKASKQPQSTKDRLLTLTNKSFKTLSETTKSFTTDAINKLLMDAIAVIKKEKLNPPQPKPQPPSFELKQKSPSSKPAPKKQVSQAPASDQYSDINNVIAEIRLLKEIKQSYEWWDLEMDANKGRGSDKTKRVLEHALDKSDDLSRIITLTDPDGKEYDDYIERVQKMHKQRNIRTRPAIVRNIRYVDNRLLDRYDQVVKYIVQFAPEGVDRNFMTPLPFLPAPVLPQRNDLDAGPPQQVPPRKALSRLERPPVPLPTDKDIKIASIPAPIKPKKPVPIPPKMPAGPPKPPTGMPKPPARDTGPKKTTSGGRQNLLSAIQKGTKLKSKSEQTPLKKNIAPTEKNKDAGIMGALKGAFKKQFATRHKLEYGEDDDDKEDDDWDEENPDNW